MSGSAQLSNRCHQLCELARDVRRRMDVSQSQFSDLVGVDRRTIWNWEKNRFAPTLSKRFRLEQLRILVEDVEKDNRSRNVEFADEPGRYNRSGRPRERRRPRVINLLALGIADAE